MVDQWSLQDYITSIDRTMKTSKLAIFLAKNQPFTMDEVEVPDLRDGEILVRNEYTTLCRSDLYTFTGKRTEKTPTILGHEIVGKIEEFGSGARRTDCRGGALQIGDRVTWGIYASNPDSYLSQIGIPQKGEGLFKYGHEEIRADNHLHGGLSEYCILRKHTPVIKIEKPIPVPIIALINCSVATVAGAVRLAGSVENRTVLITGVGMLGIIACAMCKAGKARKIIALDIDDERLDAARRFGVDVTLNMAAEGGSLKERLTPFIGEEHIHAALDFSGVPGTMESSLSVLGIGGTAVWVGATYPQREMHINAEKVVRNLHTIRGLHNYNEEDLVNAVIFMEKHYTDFPFESLVYDKFDLDTVNDAFDYAIKSGVHRVGVRI